MSLENTSHLAQMLKIGWQVIRNDNAISPGDFLTAISPWTQEDWLNGYAVLTEMGYFVGDENWLGQKTWFVAKTAEQGALILAMLRISARVSPTMFLLILRTQKATVEAHRAIVHSEIADALNPFLLSPPAGTDQRIIDTLAVHRQERLTLRDHLDAQIAELDAQIDEQVLLVDG
jgi:hypothetical protein